MNEQTVELKDVILGIAALKRREEALKLELEALKVEISRKEAFLYNSLQEEAMMAASTEKAPSDSSPKK